MTGCHAESSQRLTVTAADAEMAMRARAMVCTAAAMEQPEQFAPSWYREGVGLLLQGPSWQQVKAGAQLRLGHDRVGAVPWPRAAWQSAHIRTVNRPSSLLKRPVVDPQKEQRSAIVFPYSNSRSIDATATG